MSRASVLTELRDNRGRWTPSPRAISDAIDSQHMDTMDRLGSKGFPGAAASMSMQLQAQGIAQATVDHIGPDSSTRDQLAASLWNEYQSPQEYGDINHSLRDNATVQGVTAAAIRGHVDDMYALMGYKLPKPMTVYRAIHAGGGSGMDWQKALAPGTIFQDKGFMSSTADPNFATGWLDMPTKIDPQDPTTMEGRKERPDDVVLEIRIPAGTTIVGGSPGFVETMIHPGTKLKIISSEQRQAKGAVNPISPETRIRPFTYTHVIAEVQP